MPSAFEHGPTLTVEASPTANAGVIWSAANNLGQSTVLLGTGTIGVSGDADLLTLTANNLVLAGQIQITGGSPGASKVLTSNGAGLATWETAASGGAADDYFASSGLSSKDQGTGLHIKTGDSGGTASSAGNEFIIEGGSGNHGMSILGSGDGGSYIYLGDGAAPSRAGMSYSHGDHHLVFRSGDSTRMTIKSTGDTHLLGTAKLHFGDGTDTYFYQRADDQLALYVGGRHLFQVRGGGVFFGFAAGTNSGTFASGAALPNDPSNALANGVHIHQGAVGDYGAVFSFSNSSNT